MNQRCNYDILWDLECPKPVQHSKYHAVVQPGDTLNLKIDADSSTTTKTNRIEQRGPIFFLLLLSIYIFLGVPTKKLRILDPRIPTFFRSGLTHDMWHVTCNTWHVTRYMWHVVGVNIHSKFQLPSSYGLWFIISGRFGGKGWVTDWINY